MFSVRIFAENPPALTRAVAAHAAAHPDVGIDVALYGDELPIDVVDLLMGIREGRKSLHLDHATYALDSAAAAGASAFHHELELARSLGIRRAVIHACNDDRERYWRTTSPAHAAEAARQAVGAAADYGVTLMLENTFQPMGWIRDFLRACDDDGIRMGFCLDIGHAHVWGRDQPLERWVALFEARALGRHPVMAHLHCNDGTCDQHVALCQGARFGFLENAWCAPGMLPLIDRMRRAAQAEAPLVLENPAAQAVENLEWLAGAFEAEAIADPLPDGI